MNRFTSTPMLNLMSLILVAMAAAPLAVALPKCLPDCTDANLEGAALSGADLAGASLSGARLKGATLYRADLSGANLAGADLDLATLAGADLSRANLPSARLAGATLGAAVLTDANLNGANLTASHLPDRQPAACRPARAPPLPAILTARICRANCPTPTCSAVPRPRTAGATLPTPLRNAYLAGPHSRRQSGGATWRGRTWPAPISPGPTWRGQT